MNLEQLLQNIGCKNARNDGMDRISSLRDGRWVEMFAEMGYDRGEFIFPDGRHSSFFLVLPDGNIASADNVMCGNGFYAIANELGIDADAVLGEEPYGEFIMHTDEDGIEDEDTAISIWTPEEFQIKLQQCQQLANNQVNKLKNMNRKNTIRLTESEFKSLITESVKKIISERNTLKRRSLMEGISRTITIEPASIFDPEYGTNYASDYASQLMQCQNPEIQEAVKFMQSILDDISGNFEVELGGDIYGDTTGPYAGDYNWDGDSCYVDVVDWPAELDSAPENIKNTILEIVKDYVDENNEEWSIYGNSWN